MSTATRSPSSSESDSDISHIDNVLSGDFFHDSSDESDEVDEGSSHNVQISDGSVKPYQIEPMKRTLMDTVDTERGSTETPTVPKTGDNCRTRGKNCVFNQIYRMCLFIVYIILYTLVKRYIMGAV